MEKKLRTSYWAVQNMNALELFTGWILQGKEKPKEKKKGKTFKVKTCPKCGSDQVGIIVGGEEGQGVLGWECKKCKWKGKQPSEKEVAEEEFLKMGDGK